MARTEQIESRVQVLLPSQVDGGVHVESLNGEVKGDPLVQRYSGLVERYPLLGLHLSAVDQYRFSYHEYSILKNLLQRQLNGKKKT